MGKLIEKPKMRNNKMKAFFLILMPCYAFADDNPLPHFNDHHIEISSGPFAKTLQLSAEQQHHSKKWQEIMRQELSKEVNFAGHYRLYLSKEGELPDECGGEEWICGWIIDKTTGSVVTELPVFNGNSSYYSTIDNGTPSPYLFLAEFHPDSNMLWVDGENIPKLKNHALSSGDKKCANNAYVFQQNKFSLLFSGECEMEDDHD